MLIGEGNGNPLQYSCLENPMDGGAWWAAVYGVANSRTRLRDFTFLHWRRKWQPIPVFLPGESPGTGEPGGLLSMGSVTVGHDWVTSLSCTGEGNGNPLQYSCLENPQGRGSLVGCRLWGRTESDTTEWLSSSIC